MHMTVADTQVKRWTYPRGTYLPRNLRITPMISCSMCEYTVTYFTKCFNNMLFQCVGCVFEFVYMSVVCMCVLDLVKYVVVQPPLPPPPPHTHHTPLPHSMELSTWGYWAVHDKRSKVPANYIISAISKARFYLKPKPAVYHQWPDATSFARCVMLTVFRRSFPSFWWYPCVKKCNFIH